MKSITDILGGAQFLLGLHYDVQDCFEEYLSPEQRNFLAMLRVIEEKMPSFPPNQSRMGRPAYSQEPFFRAFLARSFFKIAANDDLRKRLTTDTNLRQVCGFRKVPSAATFSRRLTSFAANAVVTRTLNDIVRSYYDGKLVGHISRDSTAIHAREAATNKKKDLEIPQKKRYRRGRPRKNEVREPKEDSVLIKQCKLKPGKAIGALNRKCAWGAKKNSQGNTYYWKGYKLHLDVTDIGVPVTAVVTGANVHDSQLAIPMEKMTRKKVTHLYSVMDSAYDALTIREYVKGNGNVPLIDHNKRRGSIEDQFDDAMKKRFRIRTTVERANAHLKDWLIPSKLFVRGIQKVSFQLLCGVLCLAAIKILEYFILPTIG